MLSTNTNFYWVSIWMYLDGSFQLIRRSRKRLPSTGTNQVTPEFTLNVLCWEGTDDLQELRKLADVDKATIEKNMAALSSQGLRVWDFATRYVDCECDDPEKVESNLTFQSQKNCLLYGCKLCYSAPQNGWHKIKDLLFLWLFSCFFWSHYYKVTLLCFQIHRSY